MSSSFRETNDTRSWFAYSRPTVGKWVALVLEMLDWRRDLPHMLFLPAQPSAIASGYVWRSCTSYLNLSTTRETYLSSLALAGWANFCWSDMQIQTTIAYTLACANLNVPAPLTVYLDSNTRLRCIVRLDCQVNTTACVFRATFQEDKFMCRLKSARP